MKNYVLCLAATALSAAAGAAHAQPAVFEDLGTLSSPATRSPTAAIAAQGIKWYRFTLPAVAAPGYFDVYTGGSGIADTEIGLYRADGTFVVSDDNDGPGNYSALSFGATCSPRSVSGAVEFNGRDAAGLAAGTYYLAVGAFNTTFGGTGFAVTSSATVAGSITTTINLGVAATPINTPPAATSLGTITRSNDGLVVTNAPLNPASVKWYSFTLGVEVSNAAGTYLDINTAGSNLPGSLGNNDTFILLYSSNGIRSAFDDDSGPGFSSQLSFGSTIARATVGNGFAPAGQAGALAAGTYYLAVLGYEVTNVYPACSFSVISADTISGTIDVTMNTNVAGGGQPGCGSADFNGDGDVGTDADIEAFFLCVAGNCCPTCGSADFNGDSDVGTDADIEAFFRVIAGGDC